MSTRAAIIVCIADNMALIARLFYTENPHALNVIGCSLVSDVFQITLNGIKRGYAKGRDVGDVLAGWPSIRKPISVDTLPSQPLM